MRGRGEGAREDGPPPTLTPGSSFNEDGIVNSYDTAIFNLAFGKVMGTDAAYDARPDLDRDGVVGVYDYGPYASNFGDSAPDVPAGAISAFGNTVGYAGYVWEPNLGGDDSGMYQIRFRWYVVALGRWGSTDPAGYLDGPNLFRYVGDSPLQASDAMGLWGIRIGPIDLSIGAPTLYFNQSSWSNLGGDLRQGFGATLDGVIPFWNPFESLGWYDPCDLINQWSQRLGKIAREAALLAALAKWGDLGEITQSDSLWNRVLKDLTVAERKKWLNDHPFQTISHWVLGIPQYRKTIPMGATSLAKSPTGWLLAGAAALIGVDWGSHVHQCLKCP